MQKLFLRPNRVYVHLLKREQEKNNIFKPTNQQERFIKKIIANGSKLHRKKFTAGRSAGAKIARDANILLTREARVTNPKSTSIEFEQKTVTTFKNAWLPLLFLSHKMEVVSLQNT